MQTFSSQVSHTIVFVSKNAIETTQNFFAPTIFELIFKNSKIQLTAGLKAQASGLRPQGSGLRAQASGLRPQGSGLRAQASGLRPQGGGLREEVRLD